MKVLLITCSHRSKNVSFYIATKLSRKIKKLQNDMEVDIMELANSSLRSCCATARCSNSDIVKCVYADEDDFYAIYNRMLESDCILFIVPKYAPYPSKLLQFYERLVSIGWWGYVAKGKIEQFDLYQKLVGLICFANDPSTKEDIFFPLMNSFQSIGFRMLSFFQGMSGMFINRTNDNEDEMLHLAAGIIYEKMSEQKI